MLYRASGISLSEKVYEQIDCKLNYEKAIFAVGGGNNVAPLEHVVVNIFCLYVNISKKF